MTYHVARDNRQLGAFPKEEILSRYASGAILPTDLVWTDGMTTWEPASKILGAPAVPEGDGVTAPPALPPRVPPPITGVAVTMTTPPEIKPPKPKSYLFSAILATLFCCFPLGIVAIIFAIQVDGKYHAGDYQGAKNSSAKAKLFCNISAVIAFVLIVIYIIITLASGIAKHGGY